MVLQFLRLRLPGYRHPVHLLRETGMLVEDGPWSGADRLVTAGGRLLAAHSRARVRKEYVAAGLVARPEAPVLILDLVRCRRALPRPHGVWSGTTRGTVAEVDDLLWDAAASLNDEGAGEAVRDPNGFHAQYLYIWGDRSAPLSAARRGALWDERVDWLLARLSVLDRHERRFVRRR